MTQPIIRTRPLTRDEATEIMRDWLTNILALTGVTVNTAHLAALGAIDELRKANLAKREAKFRIRRITEEWRLYESHLLTVHNGTRFLPPEHTKEYREWWTDIGACFWERNARHLEMLRLQYYNAFTAIGLPNRHALSFLCLASFLVNTALSSYDCVVRELRDHTRADCSTTFAPLRPYTLARHWHALAKCFMNITDKDVPPYHQEQILRAEEIVRNLIADDASHQRSCAAATEINETIKV